MSLELQILILAATSFVTGILSGISGGGAGLVMVPLAIVVGLPPQTAVGTMKMAGLGASFGGLSVFARSGHIRKDIVKVMLPIVIVIGLATPFVFKTIDSDIFQKIIGTLLILMTPTLFIKRKNLKPSRGVKGIGYALYSGVMALQALFGTGVGTLATFVLTLIFGTTKIEANATKRAVTAVMVPITFVGLLIAGYVSLWHGLALMVAGFAGTHIGSHIAVKQGETLVSIAMATLAVISGVWLLLS
jgi:uncharacterized membrane protein YfcA